jgi:hypothetical protein
MIPESAPSDGMDRMRGLAGAGRPVTMAGDRILPALPALVSLLPEGGLRRGSTVAVTGGRVGVTSLALALVAEASTTGSWCGVVGCPDLGLVAAAELGLDLERLALVPDVPSGSWPAVVGALLDAMDVVMVWPPAHLRLGDARRLSTRARDRGAVLITVSSGSSRMSGPWPERVDMRLTVAQGRWHGPDQGHGRLRGRKIDVECGGRGIASRPRHLCLWLPSPEGRVDPVGAQIDVAQIHQIEGICATSVDAEGSLAGATSATAGDGARTGTGG